jgi:hypothetical protein
MGGYSLSIGYYLKDFLPARFFDGGGGLGGGGL